MGEWLGYVKNLVPFCDCHVDIIIIQIERVGEEKDNEFWVIRSETGECKLCWIKNVILEKTEVLFAMENNFYL